METNHRYEYPVVTEIKVSKAALDRDDFLDGLEMIEKCPNPKPLCPYIGTKRGCYADKHHTLWPASQYTSKLEKEYRQLPENKVQTCRWEHDLLHIMEQPPTKPTPTEMHEAIGRSALGEAA